MSTDIELPPLPECYDVWCELHGNMLEAEDVEVPIFVAKQMQDYARAAVLADRLKLAAEMRDLIALDGFGCACEPKVQCATCRARSVLWKCLTPFVERLTAPAPKERTS